MSTLTKVSAAKAKHHKVCAASFEQYLEAIRAARQAGHTLAEIGEAAGIGKAGVHYLLNGRGQS